jgi:predicted metalloprotease with PDZ domain
MEFIADLIHERDGVLSPETIRACYESHGLADFYRRYVAGRELPAISEALTAMGFAERREPSPLTYLGIQTHAGLAVGRVLAIDPDGPAAKTPLKVRDKVFGYFPSRETRPEVSGAVDTKYRFGLDRIEPGRDKVYIDVLREGREIKVWIQPRVIPGGLITNYVPDGARARSFLEYTPASPPIGRP